MGWNYFRRCPILGHLGHPLPIRAPHGAPQNTNDYILFPDSRVMDSMDYHWNYLSIPLKTLQKWSLGWGNQHQTLQVGSLNDYILFPDPRVMDSMDYHWNYLSIPLKTLHDYNQEGSQDSWGYFKEEEQCDLGTPITQSMWPRDSYHSIYMDKVEQKNQDFESMNNITWTW